MLTVTNFYARHMLKTRKYHRTQLGKRVMNYSDAKRKHIWRIIFIC
jgi:hypothetical protein